MSELRVAIVGGGIGGLVLALALRERGIGFEVYEQADELREIGAAVALSANGTRELRRLGLVDQVEAVSVIPSALVIRRWDTGEIIADHPIGRDGTYEATFGAPYYGVHRVALLQALADRLAGDGLNLGRRCVAVEERRSGAELRFADGTSAPADVVVGDDGRRAPGAPAPSGMPPGRGAAQRGPAPAPARRRSCPPIHRYSGRTPYERVQRPSIICSNIMRTATAGWCRRCGRSATDSDQPSAVAAWSSHQVQK